MTFLRTLDIFTPQNKNYIATYCGYVYLSDSDAGLPESMSHKKNLFQFKVRITHIRDMLCFQQTASTHTVFVLTPYYRCIAQL